MFLFLLFGRGACSFFCCLGGGVFFFCCLGGGVFCFLLFGPGACVFFFFLLFGRGTGVHSLTRLPGSSLSDPTTKETEQQKKNTGSESGHTAARVLLVITPLRAVVLRVLGIIHVPAQQIGFIAMGQIEQSL